MNKNMNKTARKTVTHTAEYNGVEIQVTVHDRPSSQEILVDALRENFSPEALATIAAHIQPAALVQKNIEVKWFYDRLTELVGGPEAMGRLFDEVGL